MTGPTTNAPLADLAARMEAGGANLTVEAPAGARLAIGADPDRARVVFRNERALGALLRGDHLALAEAYLRGEVDLAGDLSQVLRVTDFLDMGKPSRLRERAHWLRYLVDRRRLDRRSVAAHYDRPPEFFLAWLDPSRSYTHGFYASADDSLEAAQRRKLQYAIDALGLRPGMDALDVGCGWGSFLEYAGARGIRVHGITLSRAQHDFVAERIRAHGLPCTVTLVDFFDYRPPLAFDGAVFMGSLEHIPDHRSVAAFLARHLKPAARVYADFVTTREGRLAGAFLRKYIFPGVTGYVELGRLVGALGRAGFDPSAIGDDTLSSAWTVRDWARELQRHGERLAERHGAVAVRAFLLYLWSSHHFLATGRTQAYHLVAGREP
ncbi:MAG: class I SAM-dependent methyltransferase [Deltaproteobacteria bacterium]|nr:class I SAM-dependent methyltransferase [Deltaproteobacteria bacterium]